MISQHWKYLLFVGVLTLSFGCASTQQREVSKSVAAMGKKNGLVCEVHHCPMKIEEIICGIGQLSIPFVEALRTTFPHTGGCRLTPEYWYRDVLSIKAPVCPECNKAIVKWAAEYEKKHNPPTPQ